MKHIILAGCGRCGKTTLSLRLRQLGFTHYKMDSIKRGIDRNFWDEYQSDWRLVSPHMSKLIHRIISETQTDIIKDKEYYVIDTCHVYPSDLLKYYFKDTIIIFIGFPTTTVEKKFKEIRKYDKDVWTNKRTDEQVKLDTKLSIEYSIDAKEECEKLGIKFFDVSNDFQNVIDEIYKYILSELGK